MCLCDDEYTDCNEAFECGDSVTNLKYPFWGKNRGKECGFSDPSMELKCENDIPIITIYLIKYRILDWNNDTQRLKVARDDYFSGICSVTVNSTFDNTLFRREVDVSSQLNLLYNCDRSTAGTVFSTTCGTTKVSYTVMDPITVSCDPSVVVEIPISILGIQITTADDIKEALEGGFDLKWTGEYGECQRCIGSRGVCGSNDGGKEFRCFCNDGAYRDTCGSQRAPTSSMSFTFYTINS